MERLARILVAGTIFALVASTLPRNHLSPGTFGGVARADDNGGRGKPTATCTRKPPTPKPTNKPTPTPKPTPKPTPMPTPTCIPEKSQKRPCPCDQNQMGNNNCQ
jgi:outer membrane biosynthesis protein TonB